MNLVPNHLGWIFLGTATKRLKTWRMLGLMGSQFCRQLSFHCEIPQSVLNRLPWVDLFGSKWGCLVQSVLTVCMDWDGACFLEKAGSIKTVQASREHWGLFPLNFAQWSKSGITSSLPFNSTLGKLTAPFVHPKGCAVLTQKEISVSHHKILQDPHNLGSKAEPGLSVKATGTSSLSKGYEIPWKGKLKRPMLCWDSAFPHTTPSPLII